MPTPFPFQSGATLLASQLNSITELPTRTLTANGTAVATDAYSRVILDGSSITYTVNSATFGTAQVVELYNNNSTTATIVAGAGVTINGSAGLTLAQYQTAELYAVSATSFILWKSAVTTTAPGLVYLTGATFTTPTSVSLPNNTFTSTYRNYRFILSLTALTADADFTLRFRASGTDDSSNAYQLAMNDIRTTGASALATASSGTSMSLAEQDSGLPQRYSLVMDVLAPQIAQPTIVFANIQFVDKAATYTASRTGSGFFGNATQFDSLSFISSVASSISGIYRVYGYADS